MRPVSVVIVPDGVDPEEFFERMVTEHARSHGITPDRIEWDNITSPAAGVFRVGIKDHEPMTITALLSEKEKAEWERDQ